MIKSRLSKYKARMTAWYIRNRPADYVRRKKLGTHTGIHRLIEMNDFLEIHAHVIEEQVGIAGLRERYNLWMLVKSAAKLNGSIAEIGVFTGGTAMILAAAKDEEELHLFDTFEGMPETDQNYDGIFTRNMFIGTSLNEVRQRLEPWNNVYFHQGFFPDTAKELDTDKKFKLTNIDVDIRDSTLSCLEYFYPRTVPGGFLVLHDYNDCGVPGIKSAVQEFMLGKPESVIELWDTQALIVKQ